MPPADRLRSALTGSASPVGGSRADDRRQARKQGRSYTVLLEGWGCEPPTDKEDPDEDPR
jgi:hypothetical protein